MKNWRARSLDFAQGEDEDNRSQCEKHEPIVGVAKHERPRLLLPVPVEQTNSAAAGVLDHHDALGHKETSHEPLGASQN